MAGGLKFYIYQVEGLYYLCSENKGADQLRSYCAADLHLCFCICKKAGFLMTWLKLFFSYISDAVPFKSINCVKINWAGKLCFVVFYDGFDSGADRVCI